MEDRKGNTADDRNKTFKTASIDNSGTLSYDENHVPLWYVKTKHSIYYVLGVIEVLLAFRFLFRLLGANPKSGFVALIYSISGILTAPFKGIFNSYATEGLYSRSVFEPSTVIALIVYPIIAWGLVRLVRLKVARDGH